MSLFLKVKSEMSLNVIARTVYLIVASAANGYAYCKQKKIKHISICLWKRRKFRNIARDIIKFKSILIRIQLFLEIV